MSATQLRAAVTMLVMRHVCERHTQLLAPSRGVCRRQFYSTHGG
jgi:hypothetical protein